MMPARLSLLLIGSACLAGGWWCGASRQAEGNPSATRDGQGTGPEAFAPAMVATTAKASPSERMFRALEAADSQAGGDYARRLAAIAASDFNNEVGHAARTALLREWVGKDPEAAFRYGLENPEHHFLRKIVTLWAESDGEAAVRAVGGIENGKLKDGLLNACATVIAATDGERAVALLKEHSLLQEAPDEFFLALGKNNRDLALETIGGLSDQSQIDIALGIVFGQWAESDPAAAGRALAGNPAWRSRDGLAWNAIARSWFKKEPAAAAAFFADASQSEWIGASLHSVLEVWTPLDAEAAEAFVRSLSRENQSQGLLTLVQKLGTTDGAAALRVALGSKDSSMAQPSYMAKIAFENWAGKDWEGALKGLMGLESGPLRDAALAGFTEGLRFSEIVKSQGIGNWVEPMMRLAAESEKGSLDLSWAVSAMSADDISRYAAEYGDRFVKAIAGGFDGLAKADPVAAAAIADALPDSAGRNALLQPIAFEWVNVDPHAAADWVAALPEGGGRELAFQNVAGAWARHQPAEAMQWIASQPASTARDAAVREYVKVVAAAGNGAMVELARSIGDERRRDAAMLAVLSGWVGREGEAAVEAIGELDLPEAVREQFTSFAEGERWWREQGN